MGDFRDLVVVERRMVVRDGFAAAINLREQQRDFLREHTLGQMYDWRHPVERSRARREYQKLFDTEANILNIK